MKLKFLLLIPLAASVILSCAGKYSVEKEPNNSIAKANEIIIGKTLKGFINSGNDRDFYIIEVDAKSILDINLTAIKGVNHALKIWNDAKKPELLKLIDDNRKSSPERFPNFHAEKGVYYIEVLHGERDKRKTNTETPYELSIVSREPVMEEAEPNDDHDWANAISSDNEISGYFSPAYNRLNKNKKFKYREEDWYRIDITSVSDSPAILDITLSDVQGIDSILYLYDSDLKKIASADSRGPGEGEAIKDIGILNAGTYFILAAAKNYTFNHDEPYTLHIAERAHDSGYEMENNNTMENANSVVNNVISGKMNSPVDKDFYSIPGQGEISLYRVELRPPPAMDCMLSIYNSKGKKIAEINNGGKGEKEVYPNLAISGNFFISVSSKGTMEIPEGEYILNVSSLQVDGELEKEPNNSPSQANVLQADELSGYISFKGDRDYFQLNYDNRIKKVFEIKGVKGAEIKVSITDPLGNTIKSISIEGNRMKSISEMIDKKGYIIIEAKKENYDSPYIIKIRGD